MLRHLLWFDCGAGLLAGASVLALAPWLSRFYALPYSLILFMGCANLAYGSFSFSLAIRSRRPLALIITLATANGLWALGCWTAAALLAPAASAFGLAHLLGEGIFVGTLAALEWNQRHQLTRAA